MNELDTPLGLDRDGQDRACNHAAVAVFALTALAIVGGGIGWYVLRSEPARTADAAQPGPPAFTANAADLAPSPAAVPVAADAPMLRQELREEPAHADATPASRSITIIDGKTGKRETILLGSGFEDDDAPTGGIMPAAATGSVPTVVR